MSYAGSNWPLRVDGDQGSGSHKYRAIGRPPVLSLRNVLVHLLAPGGSGYDLATRSHSLAAPAARLERSFAALRTPAGAGRLSYSTAAGRPTAGPGRR